MTYQLAATSEEALCLDMLKAASEPMTAAEIGRRLELAGSRETQRRHVRAIVKSLRETGAMIVATLQGGYWVTDDEQLWRDYLEGRSIDARRILGEAHKQKKQLADATGQQLLFNPGPARRWMY